MKTFMRCAAAAVTCAAAAGAGEGAKSMALTEKETEGAIFRISEVKVREGMMWGLLAEGGDLAEVFPFGNMAVDIAVGVVIYYRSVI